MAVKEEYDVLKLIEHNHMCYVSSECVRGSSLPRWIKYHPCVSKKELFQIISEIVGQLSKIHRCRGNPCYRYVNPYSIVVSENGRVSFLDINAQSNIGQLKIMQRRMVREYFLPPEEPYYQKESVELDIYGLGKVLQYLLSEVEADPPLRRKEEAKFQKIISRCLKRHSKKIFQNVSEIQKLIPQYKELERNQKQTKLRIGVVASVVIIVFGIVFGGTVVRNTERTMKEYPEKETETKTEIKTETTDSKSNEGDSNKSGGDEKRLNMELGIVYLLELQSYEKSKEYFDNVTGDPLAEYMGKIAGCFAGNHVPEGELREALRAAEQAIEQTEKVKAGDKADYYHCILKGYAYLNDDQDAEDVLRIGKICMQGAEGEKLAEISGYMAAAYETLGNKEEAVKMYEEQIKCEKDQNVRAEIYKKTADLLVESKQSERAQEILRKGISEDGNLSELRIAYLKILLKDSNVDRQMCIQQVKEQLKEMPELEGEEEFQKLVKEYGIDEKGE